MQVKMQTLRNASQILPPQVLVASVSRMPPHVQQYVLSQMTGELRGGSSSQDRAMETALERIGLDAGVSAFWQELKRSSAKQRESVDARTEARKQGQAVPDSWISWKQASEYYRSRGGLDATATVDERQRRLPQDKKDFLDDLFYGKFRSGIGLRALWQALNDTDKQRQFMAENNGSGWISFSDLRAYYLQQEVTQLMRNAPVQTKTKVRVPRASELVPLRRMQADSISFVGAKSGQYTGVLHVMDLFSQFTWAVPVVTLGKASNAVNAFKAILRQIKERYGDDALPERMTLQTDNGGEFGKEFQDELPDNIQFVQIPANTPNQAGAIEGANKVWRGALRRLLKSKGEPLKKWSQYVGEATEIVNTRPNATLTIDKKWRSPMEVFRASMEGDTELRDKIRESIIASANRRRAPGNVTAFEPGTPVRVANADYLKESLHSNESKMSPKWSKAVFTVKSVQRSKNKNMIPRYTLQSTDNTAETKLILKVPEGQKARWHSHDTLQRVYGTPVEAPEQPDRDPDTDARPFLKNPSVAAPITGPAASVKAKRNRKQTQFYGGADSDPEFSDDDEETRERRQQALLAELEREEQRRFMQEARVAARGKAPGLEYLTDEEDSINWDAWHGGPDYWTGLPAGRALSAATQQGYDPSGAGDAGNTAERRSKRQRKERTLWSLNHDAASKHPTSQEPPIMPLQYGRPGGDHAIENQRRFAAEEFGRLSRPDSGVTIKESGIKDKQGRSTGQGIFATRDLPKNFEMMYYGQYYPSHDAYDNYFKAAKARGEPVSDAYLAEAPRGVGTHIFDGSAIPTQFAIKTQHQEKAKANAELIWNEDIEPFGQPMVHTKRPIRAGEEITADYGGKYGYEQRVPGWTRKRGQSGSGYFPTGLMDIYGLE